MSEGKAARRWERHAVNIPVNASVFLAGQRSKLTGNASDVGRGGLCLYVARELEIGTSLSLEFLLPYSSTQLEMRGVVRNRRGYAHGVEFINPTPSQQEAIERTCRVIALLD